MAKNTVFDLLTTPADCEKACSLLAPFLTQLLEKQILLRKMSKGGANSIYAAHNRLWRLSIKMKKANVGLEELEEWLDNAAEIRTGVVQPTIINKSPNPFQI